jgi:hypothetical protein
LMMFNAVAAAPAANDRPRNVRRVHVVTSFGSMFHLTVV